MARVIYVNGAYKPYAEACIHVEDRAFQFADGVYEVCEVLGGVLVDEALHMRRLMRSMSELKMRHAMTLRSLGVILRETVRRNRVRNGTVYLQVTRGVAKRDFFFPPPGTPASIVCFARPTSQSARNARAAAGVKIITLPDIRWRRPDIKSVSLLPNALAKQTAREAGADDAWFVDDDGFITEGASNNAWIVSASGEIVTRPAESGILRGVTREVLLALARRSSYKFAERAFTVAEAKAAKEAFLTSASALVMPVVSIDGAPVGDGRPGAFSAAMREAFHKEAKLSSRHDLLT